MLRMLGYGALNGVLVCLAWYGLDVITEALGFDPSPKDWATVFCAAAAGAGNVIAWIDR